MITAFKNALSAAKHLRCSVICLGVLIAVSARAQIQTAGTLFVNVDATTLTAGTVTDVTNAGTLGGFFESRSATAAAINGLIVVTNGVASIQLSTSNVMQLRNGAGGALIPPPAGLVGSNATASIEVWALNPSVVADESMVAWGKRGFSGQNMGFEYGTDAVLGAVSHTNSGDMPWDKLGGCPLNNYWHHLVYTFDGATESVFVDGTLVNNKAVGINIATNAGIMLGAQWTNNGVDISTAPALATLFLAKVRIHDGALTPFQVLNNFNTEKAQFIPAPPAAQFLTAAPSHRYSFNEPATNDATGLPIRDSIGGANGVVRGTNTQSVARFANGRLILPASETGTRAGPQMMAAYGDLPNGLLSSNSTNNGGTGEFSIEIWYRNVGGVASARVFDFGSCGTLGGNGVEVPDVGSRPSTDTGLDYFFYSSTVSSALNQRRLALQNRDPLPLGGIVTNAAISQDMFWMFTHQTDRHLVVTWKENLGKITAYENGVNVASLTTSNSMSDINDVNVWLGRSMLTDPEFAGEFDEVRIYNHVLTPGEVVGDFAVGPDTLNTGEQAVAVVAQPQAVSLLQGSAASFTVLASGSPAVTYQWLRNGSAIVGAISNSYTIPAASASSSGDTYSCVVSNYAGAAPHVITTTGVQLTVTPNQAPPVEFLHETRDGTRNNYNTATSGEVGGLFTAGATPVVVTHLGFYDMNNDGLLKAHHVGIFNSLGTTLLTSVLVPAGTTAYLTNGYRWTALDTPFILAANTSYILEAEVFNGDGDGWPDIFAPGSWNPYFVGTNDGSTRMGRFTGSAWPASPASTSTANAAYSAGNLATLPIGPLVAYMPQTAVTNYSGLALSLPAFVNGQAPISVQWYKSPSTLLANQTNITLSIPVLSLSDSGDYYVIANNASNSPVTSASVTLTVLPGTPVSIQQQPVSATVPQGFAALFSVVAVGTPPFTYQWDLNGLPISGATSSTFSIPAVTLAMDGGVYSCVVSNVADSVNYSATSSNAVLSVPANSALPAQFLHETRDGFRDDFFGNVGGVFQTGLSDALVTHLGYYDLNNDGLMEDHHVGIFATNGTLLVSVVVPAGTGAYLTNGYRYAALDTPFILTNGVSYYLGAEVFVGSGDGWPDVFAPTNWNPYFVANDTTSRYSHYGNGAWPVSPTLASGANSCYAAANLAVLPIGLPVGVVEPGNITTYVGQNAAFTAIVSGQAPLTLQWYEAPNTLLAGQTNTTLNLVNLTSGNNGDYYVTGTNALGAQSSATVHLTVLDLTSPIVLQSPSAQSVYTHQQVTFSVNAIGQQPLSYQWLFNGAAIPNATNSVLQLLNSTDASAGNYSVTVTNSLGATNSASAALQVIDLPQGSYAAIALDTLPLVYYRFAEAGNSSTAINYGTLGAAENGTYEGTTLSGVAGPQPPDFPNFDATNEAAFFDRNGFGVANGDVSIPPLNLDISSGVHITLAAWINSASPQAPYSGIIFNRGAAGANGLGVKTNATSQDELEYHWNNTYYTFESGLLVPQNQWMFVALVIQPTQATLYSFSGSTVQTATNIATHTAIPYSDVSYVGWDNTAATARRFYGAIDEPMIFNQSLTATQLGALYTASLQQTVRISATVSGNQLILSWPQPGILQRANNANGPYVDDTSSVSPLTVTPTAAREFYRVRLPQ